MSAANPRRMIATARLLASDKPGEAFAAIAALDRLLPDGQTLAGVVEEALTKPLVAPTPAHWARADYCIATLDLSDWERNFLSTVRRKARISDKQLAILASLYAKAMEK